jgi:membrane associated rhomboid family serine protease
MVSVGASAGLFGLAAAYLLDIPKLTFKEYLLGFGTIIFLFLIFSFAENQKKTVDSLSFEIDTWGHLFGLLFGLIFCKLFPRKIPVNL